MAAHGYSKYGGTYRAPDDVPPVVPKPCCCRKDEDGNRWFNLGCRLHTSLWRPAFESPRWNVGTALTGHDLGQRRK